MSGFESSVPASSAAPETGLLHFSVHSLPTPNPSAGDPARTRRGRWSMLAVLLVCAAPVVASYLAYFFGMRPHSQTNYSDLIVPARPLPAGLHFTRLDGTEVAADALRKQWLLVVVSGAACDRVCEHQLWLQRQLHESLGGEKDRVDKIWLVDDDARPRPETLSAINATEGPGHAAIAPATVLRVDRSALTSWLEPAPTRRLEDHFYVVDPNGDWMMRAPPDADPARFKRDIEKLLRVSAGWDRPGR